MPKINENKRILAIGAGGLLLCLSAGGGVWWSKGLVAERQEAITTAEAAIDDAKRKIDQIPTLEKDVIILRENVDNYTKILPDQREITSFWRTINKFAGQAGIGNVNVRHEAPGKRGKYSSYSSKLMFDATLWQFMKLLNAFENHDRFVRIVDFAIKAASSDDIQKAFATGTDPRHTITLTVQTFVYGGKNAGKNVDIPSYARKRDKYAADIAVGAQSVQLERYDYVEEIGRRDIFVDPRPTIGGPSLADNPRALQKQTIDDFIERLVEIRALHENWKREDLDYLSKESYARRLTELMTELEQAAAVAAPKITTQTLVAEWNVQVVQPMREIWRDLRGGERIDDQPNALTEERLEAILAEMRSSIQRGEYDAAIRLHDEVVGRINFDETDPRFSTAMKVQKTKEAVETIVEFSEIPMKIEGVVVFDQGRSGLLVNGKVYEEGEYLDDNLLLKTVGREEADFVFKGFVVRKKW